MNFRQIQRLYCTLRHLRFVQISNRIQRRVRPPRFASVDSLPPRDVSGIWTTPAQREAVMRGPQTQRVFQTDVPLESATVWNRSGLSHLELYNLHYFDDLTAKDAEKRTEWHRPLIERWIAENPPGRTVGWEPYPLSLRIVNWIKWSLAGNPLSRAMLDSLATQTQALSEQLEFHLLANHLLANAKALVFAGCFFSGPRADGWLREGMQLLQTELNEQILADGGHFELSPMYHSIILEDVLDLLNLHRTYASVQELKWLGDMLPALLAKMRFWLATMTHPDGGISFFNDAAHGIAAAPEQLEGYAERLRLPPITAPSDGITHLPESGYVRLQSGPSVVLVDVARIGPDYQPGHAHADVLSFEWSFHGQRVLVNSGTSCYGVSDERLRQRSTAAHSTFEIDGQDSSEVWSGFRVARRARPFELKFDESTENGLTVACNHDGYRRLPGRVIHRRQWTLQTNRLQIRDQMEGRWRQAIGRFLWHPEVEVQYGTHPRDFELLTRHGSIHGCFSAENVQRFRTTYHPQFAVSLPTTGLAVSLPPTKGKSARVEHLLDLSW
jgi:uncharacterized heparinase superfamily protein